MSVLGLLSEQHMVTLKYCTQDLTVCSTKAWPCWPFWLCPHYWSNFLFSSQVNSFYFRRYTESFSKLWSSEWLHNDFNMFPLWLTHWNQSRISDQECMFLGYNKTKLSWSHWMEHQFKTTSVGIFRNYSIGSQILERFSSLNWLRFVWNLTHRK